MPITFQCSCGAKIAAKTEQIGREFQCPKCSQRLVVPQPSLNAQKHELVDSEHGLQPLEYTSSPAIRGTSSRRSPTSTIVAGDALAVSLAAIGWLCFQSPLGAGIDSYDFSTPADSLRSTLGIAANGDVQAQLDIERLKHGEAAIEQLQTLTIHKESEYKSHKILFVPFEKNGIKTYDIRTFEKHADTGLWFSSYLSAYDMDDSELEQAIADWRKKGGVVEEIDE